MHHIINLAVFVIYTHMGKSIGFPDDVSLKQVVHIAVSFLIYSYPYWLWALVSIYKKASSKLITLNYCCLHALFLYFDLSIKNSVAPEAANFWLLYFFIAPWVLAIGAFIGKYLFHEHEPA